MNFGDFVEINPKVKMTKRDSYAFVEMKDLEPWVRTVTSKYEKEYSGSGSKFEHGDTLLARITPCLENGKTSMFSGQDTPAWGSTEFIILRSISDKSDNSFIYYFARSPEFRAHAIQNMVGTSGRQRVPNDAIADFECVFPNLSTQKAIAHILGSLDDKIESNQKMNRTLEGIAKTIFKSLFVDFNPVHAKAEGRHTGLLYEINYLFPGELVASEIGMIPKGWKLGVIGDIADQQTLGISPNKYPDEIFLHFSIPAFDERQTPVEATGDTIKSNKTIVPADSVLFSKLNPNTPRVWMPSFAREKRQICSTEFLVYLPKNGVSQTYLWSVFCEKGLQRRVEAMVTGTSKSHQRVKPKDILNLQICIPPKSLIKHFGDICTPITQRILLARQENQVLADLRDTLLPKLISSELRISDAEKFLKEAGI